MCYFYIDITFIEKFSSECVVANLVTSSCPMHPGTQIHNELLMQHTDAAVDDVYNLSWSKNRLILNHSQPNYVNLSYESGLSFRVLLLVAVAFSFSRHKEIEFLPMRIQFWLNLKSSVEWNVRKKNQIIFAIRNLITYTFKCKEFRLFLFLACNVSHTQTQYLA